MPRRPVRSLAQRNKRLEQPASTAARHRARRSLADPEPQSSTTTSRPARPARLFTRVPGFNDFKSGSNITQQQFLLFRTVIVKHDPVEFSADLFDMGPQIATARAFLQASDPFQVYIQAIANNGFQGSGDFGPLRKQQMEVFEPDKDESPVNATFINLLQAIAEVGPAPHFSRWRHTKKRFRAFFGYGRGYEAITDGQLETYATNAIEAIVECKSAARPGLGDRVDIQEAAQIVAWIKQHETPANKRILVSQDDKEVFVTIAEYDSNWLRYLRGGRLDLTSVMQMHRYGPWKLEQSSHMENLAEILLAITL
ncbi:uncharacterized protein TRUGW13939_11456 [Talaromyces rugulosus]|uniref:Uncharacterized protein n=1 Tax=Talaromyces rugulosus TaxID=121627 RepID=A0A7H8RI57_TALRU|nr:uncharacterized protein TRUGW13939_11456 [Talaromyces rugulosus]QKX64283.1 hypothetical protein TRUGW13939_11456 [Talaromyces rugulosus]